MRSKSIEKENKLADPPWKRGKLLFATLLYFQVKTFAFCLLTKSAFPNL